MRRGLGLFAPGVIVQGLLLSLELARWRAAGRRARLWWRDDDARAPGPALDRLLAYALAFDVPLTLAVIPDDDRAALGRRLAATRGVRVVQHGADHVDRSAGGGACEFPPERTGDEIAAALRAGWARLAPLPGATKLFTPPWNAVHPQLAPALLSEGYLGWSAWSELAPRSAPPRVDTHIDLLRWAPAPRFRGAGRLASQLRRQLARRRRARAWDAPIGLLTHHLDHDEAAWRWLASLMRKVRSHAALCWTDLGELLPTPEHQQRLPM